MGAPKKPRQGDRRASSVVKTFKTPYGLGATVHAADGEVIRVEPRRDGEYLVGWECLDSLKGLAFQLGRSAAKSANVIVVRDHQKIETTARGQRLAAYIAGAKGIELIRVDRPHDSIVWEANDKLGELSVVAPSWQDAGHVAEQLGAANVAAELPGVLKQIG